MVNIGGTAAKHVKLTVKAPEEINGYNGFSTENMSLQKAMPRVLQGYIPRFVQGDGSLVNISLMIKATPKINYSKSYAAFVTHDQGSNTGGYLLTYPQYTNYIILFIIYTAASVAAFFT